MDQELVPLIGKMKTTNRMNSCIQPPEDNVMEALKSRDIKLFLTALSNAPDLDVEMTYQDDLPKSIIHVAIEDALSRGGGYDDFVSVLVTAGARPDIKNSSLETIPFHEAVRAADPVLLKLLIKAISNINVQDGEGSSALHIVVECLMDSEDVQTRDRLLECLGLLLQAPGIQVNTEDLKSEATPLYYAALSGNRPAVDLLISFGADVHNDNTGETISDIIRQNIPDFDPEKFNHTKHGRPIKNILFNMIELADNVEGFSRYVSNRDDVDWNADNGQYTLLQFAAEQGRDRLTSFLLNSGSDPTLTAVNSRPAWVIAAYHGYHKVLRVFFEKLSESEVKRCIILTDVEHGQRTILHEVVRRQSPKLNRSVPDPNIDYKRCLKLLFSMNTVSQNTERIVNFRDSYGETALHYATQQPDQELVKLLLKHGANMGVKNVEDKTPVTRILPETLEEFFDSCVDSKGIITDDEFSLSFNFNFLAPPLLDNEILEEFEAKKNNGADAEKSDLRNGRPETEALWYMSESKKLRPLLKHPLIASFLWMKWQRIRSFYYLVLIFYFLFVALLTSYILIEFGGCSISSTKDCQRINTTGLKITIGVFLACLFMVELIQVAVSFKRYIASPENLIQNAILIITLILLLDGGRMSWDDKRHLAAVLIISSWFEFMVYFGLHPSFNTKVTMFYTVIFTFLRFLLWYVFFIIAFALGFYVMFHTDFPGAEKNPEYTFFDKVPTTIVKSFAMFVGELEFSDIPFTNNRISYLIFLAFLFLIVVVLMNLLNGLAVSDIGLIREEAEVVSLKSQVDMISYWESILLNDPYNFLTSWPKMLSSLPSMSAGYYLKKLPGVETFLTKMTGGTMILLFYEVLPDKKAIFYPNKSGKSCNPYRKRVKVEGSSTGGLEVKKDILETAKTLILDKQRGNQGETAMLVEKIEIMEKYNKEKMEKINQNIADLSSKMSQIIDKLK